ncbi:MAG: DUF2062 domain-containing protein [Acidobacteriota bacterium]|nr:DUF2062 domain-containing protein [Acidobacteriota bacterium]
MRALLQRLGHTLVHTGDSPERTAAAFAIGVALGFSPPLGLHTLLALLVAFVFGFNRLAILAGVYSNLPWFVAPYYALATAAGALLVGADLPPDIGARVDAAMALPGWGGQLAALTTLFRPFLWAYLVGTSLGCLLLGAIAYWPALVFIRRRRAEP